MAYTVTIIKFILYEKDVHRQLTVKAVTTLGLDYGGVDILKSNRGRIVVEVNSNPGLKIEKITGINVAGEIVRYLTKNL